MYWQGAIVGILLAIGQSLWKQASTQGNFRLSPDFVFSSKMLAFAVSPLVIVGTLLYVVATLVYMAMLARFPYSNVQGLIVTASLVSSFVIARFIFRETFSITNFVGIGLLLLGVFLLTRR